MARIKKIELEALLERYKRDLEKQRIENELLRREVYDLKALPPPTAKHFRVAITRIVEAIDPHADTGLFTVEQLDEIRKLAEKHREDAYEAKGLRETVEKIRDRLADMENGTAEEIEASREVLRDLYRCKTYHPAGCDCTAGWEESVRP